IPFVELTSSVGADRKMVNTMSVGASLALFSDDYEVLQGILQTIFGKKGEDVISENVNTTKAGFIYVKEHFTDTFTTKIDKKKQENLLVGGAEAVALGAIRAGVKFAAIYPMTPINTIM